MRRKNGFSLVELSIVLVILGLLVGGILGGQALIHAAEMRGIIAEHDMWQTAVNNFKQKYHQIPGDINNATDFWGTATTCPPVAGGGALDGTCNGNGDTIEGDNAGSDVYEMFLFWQHLQLAGLINGEFTGAGGDGGSYNAVIGENVPGSKYTGGGWSARYRKVVLNDPQYFSVNFGNAFVFGAQTSTITHGKLLSPAEAWQLDTKLDDGKPGRGLIIVRYWNNQCADAASAQDYDADYILSDEKLQCAISFRQAF